MTFQRDTIVIGASAGGISALQRLLAPLPDDLPAAVLIVLHQSEAAGSLDRVLAPHSALPLAFVTAPTPLRSGRVYLAPPDRHLVVADEQALVTHAPAEMRTRPAINPLFRTAAAARGSRVIAVQLSGLLDDGVAGLATIRRCGGLVLVQSPDDAEHAEMPQAAIESVSVDRIAPPEQLAERLVELVDETAPPVEIPEEVLIEARLSGPEMSRPAIVGQVGDQIPVACPDCGGPLWQLGEGGTAEFRCHIGHALSARALLAAQDEGIERSLWVAVRSLSERARTLEKLTESAARGSASAARSYRDRADEAMRHSERLRRFVITLKSDTAPESVPHPRELDPGGQEEDE